MSKLNDYSRLKVKKDTYYLPDPQGGVYFRNNLSTFHMEGKSIYQWIEKLMPMFNGGTTLGDLTAGLSPPYRNRVYEIGETLYQNGFVRDISQDLPHQLNENVLEKYASQIEFIENFVDSGAYKYQEFRQAKVLAIGSGPFIVSLVSALIESGHPKFHYMLTGSIPTIQLRIIELIDHAKKTDSEVKVEEVPFIIGEGRSFWQDAIQPYDFILYVSQDGNVHELRELNMICKEKRKIFLPAICLGKVGLAGPLVHPESEGCWESAWRRIHKSSIEKDEQSPSFSSTAGAILANVTVFEFFKKATGISSSNQSNQYYKLDFETLEGDWISFITHPLVTNNVSLRLVENLETRLKEESSEKEQPTILLEYFSLLTSEDTGIFRTWEEQNLIQLPLSQCYVQAVDPLSNGPADLLPEVICSGLTHEEAKREAGFTGIEMYVAQMIKGLRANNEVDILDGFIGIGSGGTVSEAVCRGLQVYLEEQLRKHIVHQPITMFHMQPGVIEDKRCRYYLNALTTMNDVPALGVAEELLGFPVIGVRTNHRWYISVGFNSTLALRNALQQALFDAQNQVDSIKRKKMEASVFLRERNSLLDIPSCDEMTKLELLESSIKVLKRNSKHLLVYDFSFEPFLQQELAGVFGVQVREVE